MTFRSKMILSLAVLTAAATSSLADNDDYAALRQRVAGRYAGQTPKEWGERVHGVKTRIATREKLIALTMDACGGPYGSKFDAKLVDFLEREKVPATLFVNGRWIDANPALFNRLAANPLFEIANHGLKHRPASVNGRQVYGINGTRSVEEIVDEIELNARRIESLTGRKPRFYRSGTAYYDEVAVKVAEELGEHVAGFSVLGDAGATYSREQVKKALLSAGPGSVVIVHMNHPESGTAAGVMEAVPELKRRGFRFVRLSDAELE